MKKKIIGILVCTLLTATILSPCVGSINVQDKSNTTVKPNTIQVKCAWSGEGNNKNFWAKTPKLDLTVLQAPRLIINTQYEILHLGDNDYGYIKVSNDSGSSWSVLKQFQGYAPIWTALEFNLEKWADEEIIIGFQLKTESNSITDGWFISSILVRGIIEEIYYEDFDDYDLGDSWDDWTIVYQTEIPNAPPERPSIIGPKIGLPDKKIDFEFAAIDYDEDEVYYKVDWGDGEVTDWIGPFTSGGILYLNHTWSKKDTYTIRAKAMDHKNEESKWESSDINIPRAKNNQNFNFLPIKLIERVLEQLLSTFPFLSKLLNYL
jgi:hypothetical protein